MTATNKGNKKENKVGVQNMIIKRKKKNNIIFEKEKLQKTANRNIIANPTRGP